MEMMNSPVAYGAGFGTGTAAGAAETVACSTKRILIFDRDGDTYTQMSEWLADLSYSLTYCRDLSDLAGKLTGAAFHLASSHFDLLLWGIGSSCQEGILALTEFRARYPNLRVVLLAPQEALAFAAEIKIANVEAFILKPLHAQDVRQGIERALKKPRLVDAAQLQPQLATQLTSVPQEHNLHTKIDIRTEIKVIPQADGSDLGLIGSSPEMVRVAALIRKVARSSVNVLLTGESGSGKEMVASAIHKASSRAKKPFVAINCAAIPRELLESELFGHAKGAFTGATSSRRGIFEEAHEGTLLLDEIGDLPLSLQAKILRLLQTRQVKPLGQNAIKEVDVRIISATHKNLKSLIAKGEFREDLFYRLNVMPIHLPPLRERRDDIIQLAEFFLKRYSDRVHLPVRGLSRKACQKLLNLPWRGNVRELENVIERAIVLADGEEITENEISTEDTENRQVSADDLFNAGLTLRDLEREYIKYVLARVGNRKEAAIRVLGIDRKTLYRKEKLFGIRQPSDLN